MVKTITPNFENITDIIVNHIEAGLTSWESSCLASADCPTNFLTGNKYRGINFQLLSSRRYISPWYLTFLQAKDQGGTVKRGENGTRIFKYGVHKNEKDDDDKEVGKPGGFVKRYTVFNSCQIDGISFPEIQPINPGNQSKSLTRADEIIEHMKNPPKIQEGRYAVPFYRLNTDTVEMPGREFFRSLPDYYLSFFHELIHSTCHAEKLNRSVVGSQKQKSREDRLKYAREELIAELGAAYLSAAAGFEVDGHRDSAGYISGWLREVGVTDQESWIRTAAGKAKKAAEYILSQQ